MRPAMLRPGYPVSSALCVRTSLWDAFRLPSQFGKTPRLVRTTKPPRTEAEAGHKCSPRNGSVRWDEEGFAGKKPKGSQ